MHRTPRAVGTRLLRVPFFATVATACLLVLPTVALASSPTSRGTDRIVTGTLNGKPWSSDARVLATTARQAVINGTTHQSCTGWTSTFVPPDTIRVLRSRGPAKGTVQVVPFADYVPQILPSEWPAYYPLEALKAGATQVKNYGWYFTIVYRGGKDALGNCYDVKDTSADQNYNPEKQHVYPVQRQAVEETWGTSLRRFHPSTGKSDFFLAEYRTGSKIVCGQDVDGKRLYQRSILRCAHKGMDFEQILRMYLEPHLEIVTPGAHDIVSDPSGDASALVRTDDLKSPMVFSPLPPDSLVPADVVGPSFAADAILGARSVDLDRDGHEDLVILQTTVKAGWEMDVSMSDGTAYGDATKWASDKTALPDGSTLLAGDFDGDGNQDVAVLQPGSDTTTEPPTPTGTLVLYRNLGTTFDTGTVWWTGPLDMTTSRALSGDFNGDGRADLAVVRDLADLGLEFDVATSLPSLKHVSGLLPLAAWYSGADLAWDTTRDLVGDFNRDGRDDLWVVTPGTASDSGPTGTVVSVLKAGVLPGFTLTPRWTSTEADGVTFDSLKVGAADVNYDGLGDLVLYEDLGTDLGTRLATLRGTYAGMLLGTVLDEPTLDWTKTNPY